MQARQLADEKIRAAEINRVIDAAHGSGEIKGVPTALTQSSFVSTPLASPAYIFSMASGKGKPYRHRDMVGEGFR